MTGFCIAGIIVAFLVFAELYSIRQLLNRQHSRTEYVERLESNLKSLKIDLREHNDALSELIEMIEVRKDELSPSETQILNHSKYIAKTIGTKHE